MMAELMGRKHGYSGGCGGSMHIFSSELGLIGGNGIVGAQIPIATGAAFSAKYRGTRQVAVAFFSEGAANQGAFHEALNMAALWDLPAVYVCENNLYAATTPATITLSPPDVAARSAAYDMPGIIVNGQDILEVYRVASEAVARARAGNGPTLIECKTYRFVSHAGGGKGDHNNPEELETWKRKDPIALFERKLFDAGRLTDRQKQTIISEAEAAAREAVDYGKQSPYPEFDDMPVTPGVPV